MTQQPAASPCLTCGACCASYRVSFYWAEAEALGLPAELTEQRDPWWSCMKGTNQAQPRCVALTGTIGAQVACSVYAQRPQACRDLAAGDAQCLRARARHGLGALSDDDVRS